MAPPVPDASYLAKAARAASGAKSTRAFARALGMLDKDEATKVGRWEKGDSTPMYEPTIRMLQLAGALNEERWAQIVKGEVAEPDGAARPTEAVGLPDLPEGLEAAVVLLVGEVREQSRLLREALAALQRATESAAQGTGP